jgi:hypothetical protein
MPAHIGEPGEPPDRCNAHHEPLHARSRCANFASSEISSSKGNIVMPITGSCHCGGTAFEIEGELPEKLTRCTCSFCAKRGALYAYFQPQQFKLTTSGGPGATYRWNSKLVAHHFCPTCGCAVFSDSPAFEPDGKWDGKTRRYGVNARLFDGFDAAEAPVAVIDGKNLW